LVLSMEISCFFGSQQESVKAPDFRALLDRAGFGRL